MIITSLRLLCLDIRLPQAQQTRVKWKHNTRAQTQNNTLFIILIMQLFLMVTLGIVCHALDLSLKQSILVVVYILLTSLVFTQD